MKYPNLRYGKTTEFAYYAMGMPLSDLARVLRRDERTVKDWLSGAAKVPFWVPELMRLKQMEAADIRRQMGFAAVRPKLGIVTGDVITLAPAARRLEAKKSPVDRALLTCVS